MKFVIIGKYIINLALVNYVIDYESEGNNKIDIAFSHVGYLGGNNPVATIGTESRLSFLERCIPSLRHGAGGANRAAWIVLVDGDADAFRKILYGEMFG